VSKSRRELGAWLIAVVGVVALFAAVIAPAAVGQEESPGDASSAPRAPHQASVGGDVSLQASATAVGGPVVIMGIDAEDGGVGSHGPASAYAGIVTSLSDLTKNGGAGMLVLGGGKSPTDDVTEFWDEVSTLTGIPATYANGAAVATQSFSGFRIVAVVSGDDETSGGGLDAAECAALAARQQDFFDFVNAGGGLVAFAQDVVGGAGCEYAFFGGFGAFTFTVGQSFGDITATPAGTAAGVSDDLDVCCWHDTYQTFPSFLEALALANDSGDEGSFGQVAAIGGASVVIGGQPVVKFTG